LKAEPVVSKKAAKYAAKRAAKKAANEEAEEAVKKAAEDTAKKAAAAERRKAEQVAAKKAAAEAAEKKKAEQVAAKKAAAEAAERRKAEQVAAEERAAAEAAERKKAEQVAAVEAAKKAAEEAAEKKMAEQAAAEKAAEEAAEKANKVEQVVVEKASENGQKDWNEWLACADCRKVRVAVAGHECEECNSSHKENEAFSMTEPVVSKKAAKRAAKNAEAKKAAEEAAEKKKAEQVAAKKAAEEAGKKAAGEAAAKKKAEQVAAQKAAEEAAIEAEQATLKKAAKKAAKKATKKATAEAAEEAGAKEEAEQVVAEEAAEKKAEELALEDQRKAEAVRQAQMLSQAAKETEQEKTQELESATKALQKASTEYERAAQQAARTQREVDIEKARLNAKVACAWREADAAEQAMNKAKAAEARREADLAKAHCEVERAEQLVQYLHGQMTQHLREERGAVTWHCLTDDGFQPYESEINKQIESAFQSSSHPTPLSINRGKFSYYIDFQHNVQINQITKAERQIERRVRLSFSGVSLARSLASPEDEIWSKLAVGIETEARVHAFVKRRQSAGPGPNHLRVVSMTKLANPARMKAFVSAGDVEEHPEEAQTKHSDSFLFHGCGETSVANIQAEGLLLRFAACGLLGKGLYGAPDPRKSLHYCKKSTHGNFMFLCRFNLSKTNYAQRNSFDEFCIYDERHVVVLWSLKLA